MFGLKKKEKKVEANRPSQEELLKQYEDGKYLQVDNKEDNKKYFKSLGKKK